MFSLYAVKYIVTSCGKLTKSHFKKIFVTRREVLIEKEARERTGETDSLSLPIFCVGYIYLRIYH